MRILHITTNDFGGAGIACIRLHQALLSQGVDSDVLTLYKNNNVERVHQFKSFRKGLLGKIADSLRYRLYSIKKDLLLLGKNGKFEILSFPFSPFNLHDHDLVQKADIIHLHWIANFLDYPSFFKLLNKRIVWTLHDMNPFMGIFHYQEDLIKNNSRYAALNDRMVHFKLRAIKRYHGKIHAIALSKWILKESSRTVIGSLFEHVHIPNGMDISRFKAVPKDTARLALNIPLDKRVVLFMADDLQNRRKGFQYIEKLISDLDDPNILFLAVGKGILPSSKRMIGLGKINDFKILVDAFSASDAFIIPSLEDNQPNTIMEAMAFGLPVIGFSSGGIPEIIKNGKTGYLVAKGDIKQLIEKIHFLIENDHVRKVISINCRKEAELNYSDEVQVKKHINLYNSTLLV